MKIILLFLLFCAAVNTLPITESTDNESEPTNRNKETNNEANISENEVNGESRAGIIDDLNPFNKNQPQQASTNKNNDDGQNNNPLEAIQNLFSNPPQFLNGSNPFEQLFSSQSGGNFLDNVKVFLVGTQGMVMPASAVLGGFQNIIQALGNMGNLIQPPTGK